MPYSSDDLDECVYLANKEDIVECRLSPEQRKQFNLAKDEALQPWIDNRAWEAVDSAEARPGELPPNIFVEVEVEGWGAAGQRQSHHAGLQDAGGDFEEVVP